MAMPSDAIIALPASPSSTSVLNIEMHESILRTHQRSLEIRPKNTTKAYASRHAEFQAWCIDKGFSDGSTVTGDKLHFFLDEQVIDRHSRKRKATLSESIGKVGKSTVCGYAAAIVDLWRQQTSMKMNSHPNPRDSNVKRLLKNADYGTQQHRRNNFIDRGIGTLIDGYTTIDQVVNIATHFWVKTRDHGQHLRNLCAFFMSHYALLRGETVRSLEFADMHSVQLEKEGFSTCYALVLVLRQGKTNQFGRNDFGAFVRNKDVRICPWGALGFYLFWRFHVENEPFPVFTTSEDWFNLKLLKSGQNPRTPLDYKTHKEAIDSAFRSVGLNAKAKTHAARGSGARMAELGGASEDQIRRLGRWNNQAMENCYLTSLPREAIRTLAGFSPAQGNFYLQRAAIEPPEALKLMLFPMVENCLNRIATGEYCQTIAAKGFLQLLQRLRTVILQDSVFMRSKFPAHPLWSANIFSCDIYRNFAHDLLTAVSKACDPTEKRLQQVMPALSQKVDAVHLDLKTTITATIDPISRSLSSLRENLGDLLSGRVPVTINAQWQESRDESRPTEPCDVGHPVMQGECDGANPVQYKMSRGIHSVVDLWREWSEGLGGGPAVRDLERRWGSKWCHGSERRFFNRRRTVIDAIIDKARSFGCGVTPENCLVAAEILEDSRKTDGKSLDWLSKHIKQ